MELWPIARNMRRIGVWASCVIALRVIAYFPWFAWKRLSGRRAPVWRQRRPW